MCRSVVDEIWPLHRVTGHDDALMMGKSSTPGMSSETSLQLKPEKREHLPPPQTPSRTEGSEQTSPGRVPNNVGSTEETSLRRGTVTPHTCTQNDLDKAIEQALATKDLVSVGKMGVQIYALTVW